MIVQTYLVDAEVLFLCGKQTLENWNFKIDGKEKILEIKSKIDGTMMKIRMIDTNGEHYGVILDMRARPVSNVNYVENVPEDVLILFLEDKNENLCSFKAIRKIQEINCHKSKEQLITAYNNASWMSPQLLNIIQRVVNDCSVCQKFQRLVSRPRVTLPKLSSFTRQLLWI